MPKYKPAQSPILDALFDRCVDQLNAGATIDDCLGRYPAWAADLAPLLTMVSHIQEAGLPAQSAARQALVGSQLRQAVLQRQPTPRVQPKSAGGWGRGWGLRSAMALLVLVLLCGGTGMVARTSAPTDPLYALKLRLEHAEQAVTRDPVVRLRLHVAAAHRRAEELQQLAVQEGQLSRRALEELHTSVEAAHGELARLAPDQLAVVRDTVVGELATTLVMLDQATTWVSGDDSALLRSTREATQALTDAFQRPPRDPVAPTASATPTRAAVAPVRSPTALATAVRTRARPRPTATTTATTFSPSATATARVLLPTSTPRRQPPRPSATGAAPSATQPPASATIEATATASSPSAEPSFPTPTETASSTPTPPATTRPDEARPTPSQGPTPRPTATEEDDDEDNNGEHDGDQDQHKQDEHMNQR